MKRLLLGVALTIAAGAHAQSVYRCVGADGNITFTQGACPGQQAGDEYDASNAPPSGGVEVVPYATPQAQRPAAPRPRVTVVGEKINPCDKYGGSSPVGGLSSSAIRSQYGRPDRVRTYNGKEDWVWYETSRRPYRSVDFDENGCATSLYESQSGRRR